MGSTSIANWLRFVFTVGIMNYIVESSICPARCQCHQDLHVKCDGQQIPFNIPTSTKSLSLNGLNIETILADPFQNLTRLRELTFNKGSIHRLSNASFINLANLETLVFYKTNVQIIEKNAFSPLINLKKMIIASNPDIGVTQMGEAFYGLRKGQLKVLHLPDINRGKKQESTLDPTFFRFLENVPIESLSLSKNNLLVVKSGYSRYLRNVKYLTLSKKFLIGAKSSVVELAFLYNLILIDISNQGTRRVSRISEN